MRSANDNGDHAAPATLALGFDAAANDFDALGIQVWGPIGAALVAATGPRPGERVLDACCGTGASAIPAAAAVGPTGSVDAVDSSAPMITVLERNGAALPQLRGHVADVLTWDHDGYDIVQAALGIFFFPDMTAGTDRLISLARPGGRIGFTIWRSGAMEAAGDHLSRAVAEVSGVVSPPRKPHLINDINRADRYRTWLSDRGLAEADVIVDERRLILTDELAWLIIMGSGYRAAVAQLSATDVDAVRERYLTGLAEAGITEIDATTLIGTAEVRE